MAIRFVAIPELPVIDSLNEIWLPATKNSITSGTSATTIAVPLEKLNDQSYRRSPVATAADLRSINQLTVREGQLVMALDTGTDYVWNPASIATDDNENVFKPVWASGPGRFLARSGGGGGGINYTLAVSNAIDELATCFYYLANAPTVMSYSGLSPGYQFMLVIKPAGHAVTFNGNWLLSQPLSPQCNLLSCVYDGEWLYANVAHINLLTAQALKAIQVTTLGISTDDTHVLVDTAMLPEGLDPAVFNAIAVDTYGDVIINYDYDRVVYYPELLPNGYDGNIFNAILVVDGSVSTDGTQVLTNSDATPLYRAGIRKIIATTILQYVHETLLVDATSGNVNVTLPSCYQYWTMKIKRIDNTANTVNLLGNGFFEGNQSSYALTGLQGVTIVASDGKYWII